MKPKFDRRPKTARVKKAAEPSTADEYLAVGVEHEEAGEKWRAGDAAKSMRFFRRAIETYDEGLHRFAQSFDLAYNLARLQFEISQQPRLLSPMGISKMTFIEIAYRSSCRAIELSPTDHDALFNHGQVLTSLAEAMLEDDHTALVYDTAPQALQAAIGSFRECLRLQMERFDEQQKAIQKCEDPTASDIDQRSLPMPNEKIERNMSCTVDQPIDNQSTDDVWVRVESPATADEIAETVVAMLDCARILCNCHQFVQAESPDLTIIEELLQSDLLQKIEPYSTKSARLDDILLRFTICQCAYTLAIFNSKKWDESLMTSRFSDLAAQVDKIAELDADQAEMIADMLIEANLTFGKDIITHSACKDRAILAAKARFRWTVLSKAQELLTRASKMVESMNLARIHLLRGDCELHRIQLAEAPSLYRPAQESRTVLTRNAGVFYRAGRQALLASRSESASSSDVTEVEIKLQIIESLLTMQGQNVSSTGIAYPMSIVAEVLEDMIDQRLLNQEQAQFCSERISMT